MKNNIDKQEALRKRVYTFLDVHPDENKNFIVNHFRMENVPRSTLYDILKRKENNIGSERKVGSGRIGKKCLRKGSKGSNT